MLAFPGMLVEAAKRAGIKVPSNDVDNEHWDKDEYPHWDVFCSVQLCRPMRPGEHWENARVIAKFDGKIQQATLMDLIAAGLRFHS